MNTKSKVQLYRRLLRKAQAELRSANRLTGHQPEVSYTYLLSGPSPSIVLSFDEDMNYMGWNELHDEVSFDPDPAHARPAEVDFELTLRPRRR